MPGWVGPTAAISLVIIALAFLAIGTAVVFLALTARQQIKQLSEKLNRLHAGVEHIVEAARRVADAGAELSGDLREEAEGFLATSRSIRHELDVGVRRVKERLADLDALYEVVHDEVEDTALDVVAKVRTVRYGAGMVGRLRRWLVRSRR